MGGGVRDRKIGGRSAETSRDLHLAVVPVAQVADHHDLAGREVGGLVGLEASTLPPVALVLLGQNWVRFLDACVASHQELRGPSAENGQVGSVTGGSFQPHREGAGVLQGETEERSKRTATVEAFAVADPGNLALLTHRVVGTGRDNVCAAEGERLVTLNPDGRDERCEKNQDTAYPAYDPAQAASFRRLATDNLVHPLMGQAKLLCDLS
jgi:hypothetical protein